MTKSEWKKCKDPDAMLEFLRGKVSDRKLRLFAVACCRSMFAFVRVNPWDSHAVETAERYADGLTDLAELTEAAESTTSDWTAAFACAEAASPEGGFAAAEHASGNAAWEIGSHVASQHDVYDDNHAIPTAARTKERAAQADLLREIVGNPFGAVPAKPVWLTSIVVALAEGIYADRAFDRLPILADALEEAGCDNAAVLTHCRSDGPHVRGCWVVDLVLGKS